MTQGEGHWTLTQEAMLDLVNEKRRGRGHSPIDHNTMITRLILRSKVVCPDVFDFRAPLLTLSRETLPMLEELLDEQFDLTLRDTLRRHASFHPSQSTPAERGGSRSPEKPEAGPAPSTQSSVLGRLKRLFGIGG